MNQELKKTQVDANGLFLQLLSDCGITANMKWDQVFKVIQGDARNTLIKTISEKKKLFQQFVGAKKKEERELERSKIDQQR